MPPINAEKKAIRITIAYNRTLTKGTRPDTTDGTPRAVGKD